MLARIAQLVEQWTENPRVGGSNPPPGTKNLFFERAFMLVFFCHISYIGDNYAT